MGLDIDTSISYADMPRLPSPRIDIKHHYQPYFPGINIGFGPQEGGFVVWVEKKSVPYPKAYLRLLLQPYILGLIWF